MSLFFSTDNVRAMKAYQPVQANPVILWKCGKCGANLLTSERRGANIKGSLVQCSNCFTDNQLQGIKWGGQR